MSADNWAVCPKCEIQALEEKEKLNQKTTEAYGKVSASEYLELVSESKNSSPRETTLRENYEIGIEGKLELSISYSCNCYVCGFSHSFRYTDPITL